jgi:hypothetical protein
LPINKSSSCTNPINLNLNLNEIDLLYAECRMPSVPLAGIFDLLPCLPINCFRRLTTSAFIYYDRVRKGNIDSSRAIYHSPYISCRIGSYRRRIHGYFCKLSIDTSYRLEILNRPREARQNMSRPRPKARAQQPKKIDDDEDDDLFAHRRRLMRKINSQTAIAPSPPSPPPEPVRALEPEVEGSAEKKRKRLQDLGPDWVRSGVTLAAEADEEQVVPARGTTPEDETRPNKDGRKAKSSDNIDKSVRVLPMGDAYTVTKQAVRNLSRRPSQSPTRSNSLLPLPTGDNPISATIPTKNKSDDEFSDEEDNTPLFDPSLLAEVKARYMTAQALSGPDVRFGVDSTFDQNCQITVECRLDPNKIRYTSDLEIAEWGKKRSFDAPRVSHSPLLHYLAQNVSKLMHSGWRTTERTLERNIRGLRPETRYFQPIHEHRHDS